MDPFNTSPHFTPTCVVDRFMLKLVSCVLSHVLELRQLITEPNASYGLSLPNCEHFLGFGWQYNFLRKFCTPVVVLAQPDQDMIQFGPGEVDPPVIQQYRQAFPSAVTLFPGVQDLDISRVLPLETVFTMSDLRHS